MDIQKYGLHGSRIVSWSVQKSEDGKDQVLVLVGKLEGTEVKIDRAFVDENALKLLDILVENQKPEEHNE